MSEFRPPHLRPVPGPGEAAHAHAEQPQEQGTPGLTPPQGHGRTATFVTDVIVQLGYASRETFYYTDDGRILNPSLRTLSLMRYGENPQYVVEFLEHPCLDAPFGARALGEHGLIAMPAALASAVSRAAGVRMNALPLFPEAVWRAKNGGSA